MIDVPDWDPFMMEMEDGGSTTYLVHGNLCYGEDLEGESVVINVLEWDHFAMGMMSAAITIGYPLHHIECAMTALAKTSVY